MLLHVLWFSLLIDLCLIILAGIPATMHLFGMLRRTIAFGAIVTLFPMDISICTAIGENVALLPIFGTSSVAVLPIYTKIITYYGFVVDYDISPMECLMPRLMDAVPNWKSNFHLILLICHLLSCFLYISCLCGNTRRVFYNVYMYYILTVIP